MELREITNNLQEQQEDYIFNFLKKSGFRPKRTAEYAKGLKKRLDKKGLRFRFSSYPNVIGISENGGEIECEMKMIAFFEDISGKPLEEEEVKNILKRHKFE